MDENLDWNGASKRCKAKSGALATINNLNEKTAIVNSIISYLLKRGKNWEKDWINLWIGLRKGNMYKVLYEG